MAKEGRPQRRRGRGDADALVLLLRASFRGEHAGGDPGPTYQLELDGEPYAVTVGPGWVDTRRAAADNPTLTLRTSARTLAEILSGAQTADTALTSGELKIDGTQDELDRFLAAFAFAYAPLAPS
jgi:putative sterol carrier protein